MERRERERKKSFDRRRSSRCRVKGREREEGGDSLSGYFVSAPVVGGGCCAKEGGRERSVVLVEKVIKVLSRCATRHENETRLAVVVTAIYTVR